MLSSAAARWEPILALQPARPPLRKRTGMSLFCASRLAVDAYLLATGVLYHLRTGLSSADVPLLPSMRPVPCQAVDRTDTVPALASALNVPDQHVRTPFDRTDLDAEH